MKHLLVYVCIFTLCSGQSAQNRAFPDTTHPARQNPSPMAENTREHGRIQDEHLHGFRSSIVNLLPKPVDLFIPKRHQPASSFDVLIHFFSPPYLVEQAVANYHSALIGATITLGSGSSVYDKPFLDTTLFISLVDSIQSASARMLGHRIHVRRILLSGFSAGYGAVRRIISSEDNYRRVDGVLLLDGIHASYVPEGNVLAEGGTVDSTHLKTFLRLAIDAAGKKSHKYFLITHSEIFPGTFVSTTEATDYLLQHTGIRIKPVLAWGPLGMQQISEAKKNHFSVLGFAGNAARDHIDHLHALSFFLNLLWNF